MLTQQLTNAPQVARPFDAVAPDLTPLFQPFRYKTLHTRNRFVMAPMTRAQATDGVPTQAITDYYLRRAAAEVGLILSEGTVVGRPSSKNLKDIPNFYGEASLAGWQRVIDAVHAQGGQMGPQLWHVGIQEAAADWPPVPYEGPDTMSSADVYATIDAFAQAALAAKNLGFDCIELHGAHGYLIDQFFWEQTNHRTDEFGGQTLGERTRFATEVIKTIRNAVGPDLTILIRLSQWKGQDYSARMAHTTGEMEAWLQPLAEAGADIFHCSNRRFWQPEFEGSDLNFAGWAKKITGQPTITVGSVGLSNDFLGAFTKGEGAQTQDLTELMRRYERGDFDLVAVGRALLQDPEWVQKVKQNRFDELVNFEAAHLGIYH